MKLLLLDNYDSFTWNLVQYLGELGAEVEVHRNDQIDVEGIRARRPAGLVVSPGPCTPSEAGVTLDAVRELAGELPGSLAGGRLATARRRASPASCRSWGSASDTRRSARPSAGG